MTGIDKVFYQNAYPVSAVAYGLYPTREPDPANLAPLRDGDLICVAQRVVASSENTRFGRVHQTSATVDDVAELEKILWRPIILRDIAGENVYNSGKYQGWHRSVELICHNGHAWSKDLHFPKSREVHIYEGDVWQAIREATRGE
ncbi:MAG: hypothetical protein AB2556_19670, partial [Candidatus Thiodiazotropha sp.]